MRNIVQLIYSGFWQGVGVESAFFLLYVGWTLFHRRLADKVPAHHFINKIHDYFTS
jgi:hypothetical protein